MGSPDTQGEGILCVMPLLANYLEMNCDSKFIKILIWEKKNLEQITGISEVHKDMSDKEIKINYTPLSSKELKVTGPSC